MLLLFGLLGPDRRPRGWKAIWTFYLMASYVGVAILLIVLAFTIHPGTPDRSHIYEERWLADLEQKHQRAQLFAEGVASELRENDRDPTEFFASLERAVDASASASGSIRCDIISLTEFLTDWDNCRQTECKSARVHQFFDEKEVVIR